MYKYPSWTAIRELKERNGPKRETARPGPDLTSRALSDRTSAGSGVRVSTCPMGMAMADAMRRLTLCLSYNGKGSVRNSSWNKRLRITANARLHPVNVPRVSVHEETSPHHW